MTTLRRTSGRITQDIRAQDESWTDVGWKLDESATLCCGEAGSGLQLVAATMASSAATRGDGRQRAAAFFFFTRQLQERKKERQKEKGRESL